MYMKDKNHRLTLRLNEQQFEFVKASADRLDVSPSQFLRMVINSCMTAFGQGLNGLDNITNNSSNIEDLTK